MIGADETMDTQIIVIDDEVDFLESVRRGLVTSGFSNITLEPDPVKAAQLLEGDIEYDLAMIDVTMPKLSGIELLERFAALSPRTACIMLTAIENDRLEKACLGKGACDYLIKPISKNELIASISLAMERRV